MDFLSWAHGGWEDNAQLRLVRNAHEPVAVVGPDLTIGHVLVGFEEIWGVERTSAMPSESPDLDGVV